MDVETAEGGWPLLLLPADLIDTNHGVIVDVEATRAIRQAEVGAARTMIERTEDRFSLKPEYPTADSAYGSAENLAWLVKQKKITPHIPVFDKSARTDGTFSRAEFAFDPEGTDIPARPARSWSSSDALMRPTTGVTAEGTRLYRASKKDCGACELNAGAARMWPPAKFRVICRVRPGCRPGSRHDAGI